MYYNEIILEEALDIKKKNQLKKEYEEYKKRKKEKGEKPISFKEFCYKKEEIATNAKLVGAAGVAIAGISTGLKGKEMLTGKKRVYHATQNRKDNPHVIDSIEKEGLKASAGGTGASKVDTEYAKKGRLGGVLKNAQKNNKGKIQFGRLDHVVKYITSPRYTRGSKLKDRKILKIDLPYDEYKKSYDDTNISTGFQKIFKLKKKPADMLTHITTGARMLEGNIDRRAIKNNSKVSKEERKKYNKEQFNKYKKNHSDRIKKGAAISGAAAGATTAATLAANKIITSKQKRREAYKKYKEKGGKADYKTFCIKIYKELYDLSQNYTITI